MAWRWWAWLGILLAGCRGGGNVPSSLSTSQGAARADVAPGPIRFVDVAPTLGITFRAGHGAKTPLNILETMGGGCAFLDYDADGWLDVFLIAHHGFTLYRNREGRRFEEVTSLIACSQQAIWQGCAVGDYNNDGYPDLVLLAYGSVALLRNEGGEKFQEVTQQAGLKNPEWAISGAFVDWDRDGWLDLYIANYVDFGPHSIQLCISNGIPTACGPRFYDPQFGRMFRNRGDGTFEEVTERWGFRDAHGKGMGVAVGDYDNDGWPDLYVANDVMPCDMYRNLKGKGAENTALLAGTAFAGDGSLQSGMGPDWGDYDNDGFLDLVVPTFHRETASLYHNEDGSLFSEVSSIAGVAEVTIPWVTFSGKFFDADNDGWLDLIFSCGHVQDNVRQVDPTQDYHQPTLLLRNRGDGTFEDLTDRTGPDLPRPIVGRGLAVGDYDNDGDLDVLLCNLDGPAMLLQNQSQTGHHWLLLRLEGTKSNRQALGARVILTVGGEQRIAEAQTAGCIMASNDSRVHFGLGTASQVERLEVRWPSGRRTVLTQVAADQILTLKEP